METFIVHPERNGPHPVVFMLMDAPGIREELYDMARRLGTAGYYVVLPNLYYRRARDFELKDRTPEGMKPMFQLMDSLSNAGAVRDTQAMLELVDKQPEADGARVGAVGYCMSGPFVFAAAAALPSRIACIAAVHGARMVTDQDDSPHRLAPRIRCETYVACAETDIWAPPEMVATLEAALDAGRTPYRLEWYPGAHHGFVFPRRAGIYHAPSAERHWERLFDLFRRNIGPAAPVS
jgi:carboxymethylenebutenolidase